MPWRKSTRILVVLSLGLAISGAYELYMAETASAAPTVVSIRDFEQHPPDNRYVVITGGFFDPNPRHSVKYQLYHGVGDSHPDINFYVPLLDRPPTAAGAPPRVILEISDFEMKKTRGTINPAQVSGIRDLDWLFPGAVRDDLRKYYGSTVDNMILVSYGNKPVGRSFGLVLIFMAVGLCFLILLPRKCS